MSLELWNKVSRPPREALKQIKGGRLQGMTDVNPQWRFKAMTEQFGPCGEGWKYEIVKLWTEPGPEGVVMAFAQIALSIAMEGRADAWHEPIPGIGGSAMVAKELAGLRANDEAYKMAVTDALSVAMKALGVAADIYAGLWDGTKYRDAPTTPHSGSDGAMESLEADMQQVVKETAEEVKVLMAKAPPDVEGALTWLEAAMLPAEAKIACWDLLPSHYRSAIKKLQASKRGAKGLIGMKDDIPA